jgi:two-component system, OmpR family, sensor histidine kinase KdpD
MTETSHPPPSPASFWPGTLPVLEGAACVALATGCSLLLSRHLETADIVMIYTTPIILSATRHGRSAALATSLLAVMAFDFFFVAPRFTLAIGDLRHLLTFAIMLGLGLVIGDLTERVRRQAAGARRRERLTLALYRLGEALVQARDQEEALAAAHKGIQEEFLARVTFLLPGPDGKLAPTRSGDGEALSGPERAVAQLAFDTGQPTGRGTAVLPGSPGLYLPLKGAHRTIGAMALGGDGGAPWQQPDQRPLLESFANQTALALERAILARMAHGAQLQAEREQLRNALLSSVSHDLRTPLAGITGAATTLLEDPGILPEEERRGLLGAIQEEAFRLHRLVGNLLDLTRLESGALHLKREWLPAEEVVGSALDHLGPVAEGREVRVDLDRADLLFQGDPCLLEQLLINLLENALKFSPDGPIGLRVAGTARETTLTVSDRGPGIPEGMETRIFDKLFRIPGSGRTSGAGLGLAICRGITLAHGGTIAVANDPEGGARFTVTLPFDGAPPAMPQEESSHER